MKDFDVYRFGRRGEQYGIWNSCAQCWQFGICEDTPMLAEARLAQKIGDGARKWRFQPRPLPKEMRKAGPPDKPTLIELQRKDYELKQVKKQLNKQRARWTAKTDPGPYAKLVQDLRDYANLYRSGETLGKAVEATEDVLEEAAKAIDTLARELCCKDQRIAQLKKELQELHTRKKVVQRGSWVKCPAGNGKYCSVCQMIQPFGSGGSGWDFPYCPHCGAKMTAPNTDQKEEST